MLIFINTIIMGVQADVECRFYMDIDSDGEATGALIDFFSVSETLFKWMFLTEILVRLVAERTMFFFGKHWRWNFADVVLNIAAFASIGNFTFFRALRMIRTVRMLHILQAFRQFD